MSMQSLYEITLLRAIGHVEGRTDASIVGDMLHRDDATAEYIVENNTYTWYHAIAEYYRPRRIGEIGSRRGYSLKAMMAGTMRAGVKREDVGIFSWDNCSYVHDTVDYLNQHIRDGIQPGKFLLTQVDSQMIDDLGITGIDLFQVDADHSEKGAYHDLELALPAMRKNGIIIVDDIISGRDCVKIAADRFIAEFGLDYTFIPCLRGMYLIEVK